MSAPRIANAPLSYGAFEYTVGSAFPVPDPERVLAEIAGAGYAGIDLGPPGFLGEGDVLRARLEANGLELVGGFVPIAFSERECWDEGLAGPHATLDAASLGACVFDVRTIDEFETALREAAASDVTAVVHIQTDPLVGTPAYERHKATQQSYLRTPDTVRTLP